MPTYRFLNENNGEEFDEFMSMSEKDKYLEDNSNFRQVYTPIALAGDHLMGVGPKVDGGFNENMQRIAAAHPSSPMADRYGSGQTTAQIKTRNAVDNYKKKTK
jgi:hypothetical protein|tara:strand:+ start:672 stop:980 length:309 start_codon:yes stop_codon:yes gene_type:complete